MILRFWEVVLSFSLFLVWGKGNPLTGACKIALLLRRVRISELISASRAVVGTRGDCFTLEWLHLKIHKKCNQVVVHEP